MVQVCETMANPKTRKRELAALQEAMRERQTKHALIVTREEEEHLDTEEGIVDIVPAWRFLLMNRTKSLRDKIIL